MGYPKKEQNKYNKKYYAEIRTRLQRSKQLKKHVHIVDEVYVMITYSNTLALHTAGTDEH